MQTKEIKERIELAVPYSPLDCAGAAGLKRSKGLWARAGVTMVARLGNLLWEPIFSKRSQVSVELVSS